MQDNLGHVNRYVVTFAVALFFFILMCNWMEMIPSEINKHTTSAFADRRHQPHLRDGPSR